ELLEKVDLLLSTNKQLEKKLEKMQLAQLSLSPQELDDQGVEVRDGAKFIYKTLSDVSDAKIVRMSADNLTKKFDNLILAYAFPNGEKLSVIVAVSKKLLPEINAKDIAAKAMPLLGGKGGGQPSIAQIGGVELAKKGEIEEIIIKQIG
ncbi:MAG: hypothetical protein DGJ47_000708, partial [Rickettsiaceae bacterium]